MEENEDPQSAVSNGDSRRIKEQIISTWLSPVSDHFPTPRAFPTPRGFHFLAAPTLPSSPSAASTEDSNSPETYDSSSWNRNSGTTDTTEFNDLYDASDDEGSNRSKMSRLSKGHRGSRTAGERSTSAESRRALPPLVIPQGREAATADSWSAVHLKSVTSPVPPTPPAQLAMSPAAITFLKAHHARDVPTISAPPSLDGSLSSDQLAAMSAPPTPSVGNDEDVPAHENWSGVQLQPAALATLRALSGHHEDGLSEVESDGGDDHRHVEQVIEIPSAAAPMVERRSMGPTFFNMLGARQSMMSGLNPPQPMAGHIAMVQHRGPPDLRVPNLARLEIPSPGMFFSALSPRTRTTWNLAAPQSPDEMVPPTSTTAEQFYRAPWNEPGSVPPMPAMPARPANSTAAPAQPLAQEMIAVARTADEPVEQVIEFDDPYAILDDNIPTARPVVPSEPSTPSVQQQADAASPDDEVVPTEIVQNYDPVFARKQQEEAVSHIDRTGAWLMAQKSYLMVLADPDAAESEDGSKSDSESKAETDTAPEPSVKEDDDAASLLPRKKQVRFSDVVVKKNVPRSLPSKVRHQESAYYRAFQEFMIRSRPRDVFCHRVPRFELLQAQRVSLRLAHRSQLLGKYQLSVVPQSAKKRLSANVARSDAELTDDVEKLRREKEHEAMLQMSMANWQVAAIKLLNGGRLIRAPVARRLAGTTTTTPTRSDRARILDVGGQATCDWAWHCAMQYPSTKIYTVTAKAIRQLSNSNIRGPPNHRQVAVARLTRLPFADNYFDLVSARELHTLLKLTGENGEDEWEGCLRECYRVLKPGGYLDFALMDSDIINAGPMGLAKSVEFGFLLKTLGYDPTPTKIWLSRLARAGFDDVRRAWTCLPMGEQPRNVAAQNAPAQQQDTPPPPPAKMSARDKLRLKTSSFLAVPGHHHHHSKDKGGNKDKDSSSPASSSSSPSREQPPAVPPKTGLNLAQPNPLAQHPPSSSSSSSDGPPRVLELEAMVHGSTALAASITGLVGGWAWERWLLRCEVERLAGATRLLHPLDAAFQRAAGAPLAAAADEAAGLDGVAAVVEEGRVVGAAWRMLSGYARKPRAPPPMTTTRNSPNPGAARSNVSVVVTAPGNQQHHLPPPRDSSLHRTGLISVGLDSRSGTPAASSVLGGSSTNGIGVGVGLGVGGVPMAGRRSPAAMSVTTTTTTTTTNSVSRSGSVRRGSVGAGGGGALRRNGSVRTKSPANVLTVAGQAAGTVRWGDGRQ